MTSTATEERPRTSPAPTVERPRAYSVLMGIAALAVLLQGLWAGVFLEHDGERDAAGTWIEVHARGGEIALGFAALATLYAMWRHRSRSDLWVGGLVFTALLVLESYIGGLIVDQSKDTLTAIHVPLAMAIMGLAVWLPLRASRRLEPKSTPRG